MTPLRTSSQFLRQLPSIFPGLCRPICQQSAGWSAICQTRTKRVEFRRKSTLSRTTHEIKPTSNQTPHPRRGPESDQEAHRQIFVKVRYLRPGLWAISASAGIFALLAFLEAREQTKPKPARSFSFLKPNPSTPPQDVLAYTWNKLDPISKLSIGIIATNGAVHLSSFVVPKYWGMLSHTPALNLNYSLFTSSFVHYGPVHLFTNMYVLYNFLRPVGNSRLFEGSPYHTLAFFLSTGVLSGYAQHFQTLFAHTSSSSVFVRSGGASGAVFGVFGAFCMQYPDANVGIILIPFSVAASTMLPCAMAFDLVGLFRPNLFGLSLGHAAHLSGALLGIGYSYFDGKNKIWKPLVGFFRRRLQA